METRLTPSILLTHGFVELDKKDVIGSTIYSLALPKTPFGTYPFDIRVVLNPHYPDSNANSGIVSLYSPEGTISAIPEDLWDKEEWTEEDQKRADEGTIVLDELHQPIAWHVTTYERLEQIIESLTLTTLEYVRQ